jgi:SAM-dependent methyltransferase
MADSPPRKPARRWLHVCPAWFSWSLANPFRALLHNPEGILSPYIRKDDSVLDIGCGPGYFSIPLATLVGASGSVVAVDIQDRMLDLVRRRAERAGLASRLRTHLSTQNRLGVSGRFDFVLAFWMAHEVRDHGGFFGEIAGVLKPEGRLLLVEPVFHVGDRAFRDIVRAAERSGLAAGAAPRIRWSRAREFSRSPDASFRS